ncbi:hypothetical protein ACJX0J_011542, partial [Zea mays]
QISACLAANGSSYEHFHCQDLHAGQPGELLGLDSLFHFFYFMFTSYYIFFGEFAGLWYMGIVVIEGLGGVVFAISFLQWENEKGHCLAFYREKVIQSIFQSLGFSTFSVLGRI